MAGWIFKSVCCFLIVSLLILDIVETRRSRYGSVRTRVRTRIRQRVRYGSRISYLRHGSSPFTRSTWQVAFLAGSIYGGSRYMRSPYYHRYRDRMPYICTNYYDTDQNGTMYGYFVCPRNGEPMDFDRCCGRSRREYCCRYYNNTGQTVGIVIGVLLLVVIVGVTVYCCVKKSGKAGHVFGKVPGISSNRLHKEQAVPLNQEAPVMMMTTEQPGPPAGAYAPPSNQQPGPPGAYMPPGNQPPPPGSYPQPSPGEYPPPAYTAGYDPNAPAPYPPTNEKPQLPPGEVNTGGYPYPSDPGVMPYPADPNRQPPPPDGYGYGPPTGQPYPSQPYPSHPAPPYPQ
ncbi:putative cuticle collagen 155 isoform X2 [Gigantopelta aegis]|uniref:putative cuticle collagen 155 isoform X2 n=1 Tax=Gigantopelta aegis TaxID=1735272 RepID=UPI001B88A196|nr:putative cuticle collagen 155 isoform X2 [Gigantopelta aegis]